ncbi:MAG: hypothetical protein VR68_11865 [Peptococcaceae bacterium BRH_c4a]|nr:MAG: hypothetical protein VR68_11865 [Peptococcaceae bacterium BRH_c4a]
MAISIPEGYCQCGCGQKTKLAPYGHKKNGWVNGKPIKYIHGHNQHGSLNCHYNMGLSLHKKDGGARWVIICRDGSRVYFARAVIEAQLKRHLESWEHVHHINRNTLDDNPENLRAMECREHHRSHIRYTDEFLISKFRELALSLNRLPRGKDIDIQADMPYSKLYNVRFGSLYDAVVAAGLEEMEPKYFNRLKTTAKSNEWLLQQIRELSERIGRLPSKKDIDDELDIPSYGTYEKRFGGLKNTYALAGLTFKERGGLP